MKKAFIIAVPEEVKGIHTIHDIPVFYSGVGKLNAALCVADRAKEGFTQLINIGSSGSTKHALGEIIKIGRVYQDIDCSPICAYGETAFENNSSVIELDPAASGTCFSTDYFYETAHLNKYAPDYLRMIQQVSVFDMELFGIAKACKRYQIKLSAYKWVSDDGDFSSWQQNCEIAFRRLQELLMQQGYIESSSGTAKQPGSSD